MRKNSIIKLTLIISFGIIFYFLPLFIEVERIRDFEIIQVPQSSLIQPCENFLAPSSPRILCGCEPKENEIPEPEVTPVECSMCSYEADLLGPGQRVISYSFYKSKYLTRPRKNPRTDYYGGISKNLKAMRELYPGWVMRVYSNHTFTPGDETCNLMCSNQEDLYWCDVSKIRNPKDPSVSARELHGMFWRFFPLSDPLVSIFLSRDLDSLLGTRRRNAVKEWVERKDKAIHLMRDHPTAHKRSVMGGMWGMRNDDGLIKAEKREGILKKLIELEPTKIITGGVDQYALKVVLYTEDYFPLILAHDCFNCEVFNKTECIPFPDGGWTMDDPIPLYQA